MRKMRFESLEHLLSNENGSEVAKMAFRLADQSVRDLRSIGIEVDFVECIILKGMEFQRKNLGKFDEKSPDDFKKYVDFVRSYSKENK